MFTIHLKNFSSFFIRFIAINIALLLGCLVFDSTGSGPSHALLGRLSTPSVAAGVSVFTMFLAWMWVWKVAVRRWLDHVAGEAEHVIAEVVEGE